MEFSVLMAVYKNDIPNEVDNAICSVLNQTFSPTEIVIVVDGPVPQALDELLNSYAVLWVVAVTAIIFVVGVAIDSLRKAMFYSCEFLTNWIRAKNNSVCS